MGPSDTMFSSMRERLVALVAMVALIAFTSGCFGYNRSAKRWSYVGDTVLMLGGGAVIAGDQLTKSEPDMGLTTTAAKQYNPPFSGLMVAGVVLAAAGLFGLVFNITRPEVKTSR